MFHLKILVFLSKTSFFLSHFMCSAILILDSCANLLFFLIFSLAAKRFRYRGQELFLLYIWWFVGKHHRSTTTTSTTRDAASAKACSTTASSAGESPTKSKRIEFSETIHQHGRVSRFGSRSWRFQKHSRRKVHNRSSIEFSYQHRASEPKSVRLNRK